MKIVVEKSDRKRFDFLLDEEFEFILDLCSFCKSNNGYILTTVNKKNLVIFSNYGYKLGQLVKLHRVLFELHNNRKLKKDEVIDHMDMCRTNNKIVNLRAVKQSENLKNRKLRENQIYYNIYHNKHTNYFEFKHQEKGIERKFRSLHEALAFFVEYDKKNDYVLTKHIHEMKPIDGIENVALTPDGHCDKCGKTVWNKNNLKRHQQENCPQ